MEIKKEEEEEKKRPPNLSKTLNNWQKELCLLDLCPTQQWAFLRVLWHHLRQLRFSEFLIVTLGEESSVQLRLLWDKEKNLLGVICQVFFLLLFLNATKGGGDQEFWVLVSWLYPRDKYGWIHLIEFLSPYEFAHSETKTTKVGFHFTSLGWVEIHPE